MQIDHSGELGSFSYAVSGYFFATSIGRYTSIGEQVQIGRQDHPLSWLSTSPVQYLNEKLFQVGEAFEAANEFHSYKSHLVGKVPSTILRPVKIGHDVWIGHGAFIRSGISVGDGAVVAAGSVVVKDVAPYAIVGGNPAKFIRYRFPLAAVEALIDLQWWRFAPWQLGNVPFNDIDEAIPYLRDLLPSLDLYKPAVFSIGDLSEG
jgi:acetyltransferase-like isoleucine patch superfamily enzyme